MKADEKEGADTGKDKDQEGDLDETDLTIVE